MYQVKLFNQIAENGLKQFNESYQYSHDLSAADAILLRSHNLHQEPLARQVKVIARAGAGVNNIPVSELTALGIPVLNTPGANANAVKELVISGMLLASRHICRAWHYVAGLDIKDPEIEAKVEQGKKQFAGVELAGRTMGVIGLGAIGVKVANAALGLQMNVIGYDPKLSVRRAWELSSSVQKAMNLNELLRVADFISFHVPLIPDTEHLLDLEKIRLLKENAVVLNFARGEVVDESALSSELANGRKITYVTDFPNPALINYPSVISLPHLGASTAEAEENCARMAVEQIKDFLENGNICNSVNFPEAILPSVNGNRLVIANQNIPNMVGQISTVLAKQQLNIVDLLNKSRDDIAYTLVDLNDTPSQATLSNLANINGVLSVRLINN